MRTGPIAADPFPRAAVRHAWGVTVWRGLIFGALLVAAGAIGPRAIVLGADRPDGSEVGSGINESEATPLRHFTFEADDDQDYDGHPDDWSRRIGDGFPAYVKSGIDRTVARKADKVCDSTSTAARRRSTRRRC